MSPTMASASDQGAETHERTHPHLQVTIPTSSTSCLHSPGSSPSKQKEKAQVPSSGRGGLGNIRASKSRGSNVNHPPLSPSTLFLANAFTMRAGSSGSSDHSSSTTIPYSSSGAGASNVSIYPKDELADPQRTTAAATASRSPRSVATRRSSVSSDYARQLAADVALRTDGKRSLTIDKGAVMDRHDPEAKKDPIRTGRGGAGVYPKMNKSIDAARYPTTAELTREHEMRNATQERLLIEASRTREFALRRIGRGGAGNFKEMTAKRTESKDDIATQVCGPIRHRVVWGSGRKTGKKRENHGSDMINKEETNRKPSPTNHARHHIRGSSQSHAVIIRKCSIRPKSTVKIKRKGFHRLWSRFRSVGVRGRQSHADPVFEIVDSTLSDTARLEDSALGSAVTGAEGTTSHDGQTGSIASRKSSKRSVARNHTSSQRHLKTNPVHVTDDTKQREYPASNTHSRNAIVESSGDSDIDPLRDE